MAEKWLNEHNKRVEAGKFRQRHISPKTVQRYAADMKAGNWLLNGQGIEFDDKGNLTNGQHRLWAIKDSGRSVPMVIMRGTSSASQNDIGLRTIDTVDIGMPRNFAMQLRIDSIPYSNPVASATRALAMLCANQRVKVSPAQGHSILHLYYSQFQHLIPILVKGINLKNVKGGLLAPLALYRNAFPEQADKFVELFTELANLPKGHPALMLSKYFNSDASTRSGGWAYTASTWRHTCTALYHFHNGNTSVGALRGNDEAVEWLLGLQKANVKRIRELVGTQPEK